MYHLPPVNRCCVLYVCAIQVAQQTLVKLIASSIYFVQNIFNSISWLGSVIRSQPRYNKRIALLRIEQRPKIAVNVESITFSESEYVPRACNGGSSCSKTILCSFESDTTTTLKR